MARPQHLYDYSLIYGLVTNRCVYYILFEPVLRIYALCQIQCTHVIVCLEVHSGSFLRNGGAELWPGLCSFPHFLDWTLHAIALLCSRRANDSITNPIWLCDLQTIGLHFMVNALDHLIQQSPAANGALHYSCCICVVGNSSRCIGLLCKHLSPGSTWWALYTPAARFVLIQGPRSADFTIFSLIISALTIFSLLLTFVSSSFYHLPRVNLYDVRLQWAQPRTEVPLVFILGALWLGE